MKTRYALSAAAMFAAFSVSATSQAAPITRTFTGTLTFTDGGPVTFTTFGFGFTYDTASGLTNRKVDYFTTSSNYPAFDASNVFVGPASPGFTVDGAGGGGLYYNKPDFFINANDDTNASGSPFATYRAAGYTVGDGSSVHFATLGTLVETTGLAAGVPEPTSWGMMIAGTGAIGVAMRRRQRVAVRIA